MDVEGSRQESQTFSGGVGLVFDEGLRRHMLRVYNYMGLGLVVTGVMAFAVGNTPALYVPIYSTPLKWVVIFAPLVFVVILSLRLETLSLRGAQALFFAFCAVMGLSLASVRASSSISAVEMPLIRLFSVLSRRGNSAVSTAVCTTRPESTH